MTTIQEYKSILRTFGPTFDGGSDRSRNDIATEWREYFGDDISVAKAYMDAGCWDACTAERFRKAKIKPSFLTKLKPILGHDDPIYSVCNGDLNIQSVIDAIRNAN
jgi:hypothetical protein